MSIKSRRDASKQRENESRQLSKDQMQKTTDVWDQLQNGAPTQQSLDASVSRPSFWDQLGSQAAGVDTQQNDQFSGGGRNQSDAGQMLRQIATTGYTDADRQQQQAAMAAAQMQTQQAATAQRQATLANAAARGQRGGGGAMMAALAANQGANNSQALANMQAASSIAANGQQRRLAATEGLASLGGQQRSQDLAFSQAQTGANMAQANAMDAFNQNRAGAMDAWNQYNAQARAGAAQQAFSNQEDVAQGTTQAYGNAAAFNATQADAERARRNQAIQMMINPMQKVGEFFASKYGGGNKSGGSSGGGE